MGGPAVTYGRLSGFIGTIAWDSRTLFDNQTFRWAAAVDPENAQF